MAVSRSVYVAICAGVMACALGSTQDIPRQTLWNHVPRSVRESRRLAPLSPDSHLDLAIGLPLRNREALDRFIAEVSDPASQNYRRYLAASEFTEYFGPTQENYDKLIAFVEANGFTVTRTHPNRMLLDVTGPVAAIDAALHVKMTRWEHPKRGGFIAPDRNPWLDADVVVLDISGLDDFELPKPMSVRSMAVPSASPLTSGSGPGGLFIGNDFRAAYAPGVALTGAGQSIGLLEFDGFFASDVTANFKQAGLPPVPVKTVLLDGSTGAAGVNNIEVILDIMMAAYMAPGASVIVYEGYNLNDVLNRMVTDNVAKQLSSSWGFSSINATTEQIFKQMIAQGQSLLQASGDSGAYQGAIMPPSDDPNVTVVGGTALSTMGQGGPWLSESTWSGSGGGVSTTYPIPSYQQPMNMRALGGSNTMRNVPDVALTAAIQMFLVQSNGKAVSVGGTSAAAPLWAGFVALSNQQAAANQKPPAGFLNPALYALGMGSNYLGALHDIASGSNGFAAASGFDLATGWGTPAGQALIDALSSTPGAPSFALSTSPGTVSIKAAASATTTVQITAQNAFSGAVKLSASGLPDGVTAAFGAVSSGGASVLTLTAGASAPAGATTVTILGSSATASASTSVSLTVTATAGYSLKTSAASLTVKQGASGTTGITVVPTNRFSSPVSLTIAGLPVGVSATFSPASTAGASTLTLVASGSATVGATNVTVTGKSGTLSASVMIAVTVTAQPTFSLTASPGSINVVQSATVSSIVTVVPKTGFSSNVAFVVSGLPKGVTAAFNPATATSSSVLTFTAASSATAGTTTVTVTGMAGTVSASVIISLTVKSAPSFSVGVAPSTLSVVQGAAATDTITVVAQNGFTGVASLTITGLPAGVTAAFSPTSTSTTSKLTLTATPSAKIGSATLTVTGLSGGVAARATLALSVVAAPSFGLASGAAAISVAAGGTLPVKITVVPQNGFHDAVALTTSGLPAGVTATFSPSNTNTTSLLTFSAAASAPPSTSQVTIKGTSASLTATVTIKVVVAARAVR